MHILYVDESGCTGELSGDPQIQPVFVISGIIINHRDLGRFTIDFLYLKERFFPGLRSQTGEFLDWIQAPINGSELRKHARDANRDKRRHALGFLDKILAQLENYNARLLGRVFIKASKKTINSTAIYTSVIQGLAADFQHFLEQERSTGFLVLDSRNKAKNTSVSHSIFTQKFRQNGDAYSRIIEMPLFGHDDNHAVIQTADFICSALLFPMATYAYCLGHIINDHVHLRHRLIRDKFGIRIKKLQYRYQDKKELWQGGIATQDGLNHQHAAVLFGPK